MPPELISPVATSIVVLVGFLANSFLTSSRLSSFESSLTARLSSFEGMMNKRLDDLRDVLRAELRATEARLDAKIDRNHSEMLAKLAEIERRVESMEARPPQRS